MLKNPGKIRVGLRTSKTAAAIVISMVIVEAYGASSSKLIFAMLGAMAAVQPTLKDSVESCLTQIMGVFFGGLAGVLLLSLPIPPLVAAGIGVILVITLYNACSTRFSPSLPCFIVVLLCTTPNVAPIPYALGRIWNTAIGLGVGILVNMLIFPYDNSRAIRLAVESLDEDLIHFLEDLFDGNDRLPNTERMAAKNLELSKQLRLFANQKLLLHLKRQRRQLESFRACEEKAKQLASHMEVLCRMGIPGRLSEENRRRLSACGAEIRDDRKPDSVMEKDIVTNYHVQQILTLRRELMEALRTE